MVISAISVLSLLVTEFTYVAHVNQQIAFDSLDSVKAHYLAKAGLKLSLLRLKAYKQVKSALGSGGAASALGSAIPKSMIDKIWSFPFMYPVPTTVPGLTPSQKDSIEKFQANSSLDGQFTALIESESSRYNLNMILSQYAPPAPSPSPGGAGGGTTSSPEPSPSASFDPQAARDSLYKYLLQLMTNKFETDDAFSAEYRDYRLEDLLDNIVGWADITYQRRQRETSDDINKFKQAPFYSLSELHMIPLMDDDLYDLFAPGLTANATPGINVNTMEKNTLRALVPGMTDQEATDFYTFRDSTEEDNSFKTADDFFNYLLKNVGIFHNDKTQLESFEQDLSKRNVRIVTDETEFKITVTSQVNQATRVLDAWVTLNAAQSPNPSASGKPTSTVPGTSTTPQGTTGVNGQPQRGDPGLKITFMRIL
jgi:hypothetical protein